MSGNTYVRSTDPGTSHRAVVRLTPNLPTRQRECFAICDSIAPCTRNQIRARAYADGHSLVVAETIRRRATDLINAGILHVVSGSGDSEILDFVGPPGTVIPLHGQGPQQHPAGATSGAGPRRSKHRLRRPVPVEDVPVHAQRRLVRRRDGGAR